MKQQSMKSQKGEIEFRRKLVKQQIELVGTLNGEMDARSIERVLCNRMKNTLDQMTLLRESGVALSPYIEIGAERCQRSLVMENDLNATGAAIDISYHMLRSCDYYKRIFNKGRAPLRICCDANSLPFMTDSVPFMFCYETLHHFPSPTPIIKEVHRVLSPGGHFFFDEEPYRRVLHINLYKEKRNCSKESLSRSNIRKILDHFLSASDCNEVEHGIVENNQISLGVWKQALSVFHDKNVTLNSMKHIDSELFSPKHHLRFLLAYIFGGGISGICRKSSEGSERRNSILDVLACPSCIENGHESKLYRDNFSFFCGACYSKFPVIDDIVFLFPSKKLEQLYPEVFEKASKRLE